MSASQKKPYTRRVKRVTLPGRTGGGNVRSTFRGEAAYLKRLRRIEVVLLTLTMKLKVKASVLDSMLDEMVRLSEVVEPKPGSGNSDTRDALPISHSGPADGQTERDPDAEQ